MYVESSCVLNCFMLSSLPCLPAFADLLSLHPVTFFMFFNLVDPLSSAVVVVPVSIVHTPRGRLGSLLPVGTEFCL